MSIIEHISKELIDFLKNEFTKLSNNYKLIIFIVLIVVVALGLIYLTKHYIDTINKPPQTIINNDNSTNNYYGDVTNER